MQHLKVNLSGVGGVPLLKKAHDEGKLERVVEGLEFTFLEAGMESGAASVAIAAPLAGGRAVFLELSLDGFLAVAKAFEGRRDYLALQAKKAEPH